jgi:hypothetical protein
MTRSLTKLLPGVQSNGLMASAERSYGSRMTVRAFASRACRRYCARRTPSGWSASEWTFRIEQADSPVRHFAEQFEAGDGAHADIQPENQIQLPNCEKPAVPMYIVAMSPQASQVFFVHNRFYLTSRSKRRHGDLV